MPMPTIQGAVGNKGRNLPQDVRTIQKLINDARCFMPGMKRLAEDGRIGPKTLGAIAEFQKKVVGMSRPDSRVDRGKTTLEQMWIHSIAGGIRTKGEFRLEIHRKSSSTKSIIGNLLIGGEFICYTLELPWYWNRNDVSCIPFGQYSGSIRTDGDRGWRIELKGVPGRTYVQIHVGNYPREIEGCILVGMGTGTDAVRNSRDALKLLQTLFKKAGKPTIKIKITGSMQLPAEMVPPAGVGVKQGLA